MWQAGGMITQPVPLTRREFLYYIWAASMALFIAEGGGAVLWYALPRFKPGEFGGTFTIPLDEIPVPDSAPKAFDAGRFWLINIGPKTVADPRHPAGYSVQTGILALYKVCVHLGCLYQWRETNDYFHCPCHGSLYLRDGTRVHKPATRDLDKFLIRAVDAEGNELAKTQMGNADDNHLGGQALVIPEGTVALVIDTGKRIRGRTNDGPNTVPDE